LTEAFIEALIPRTSIFSIFSGAAAVAAASAATALIETALPRRIAMFVASTLFLNYTIINSLATTK